MDSGLTTNLFGYNMKSELADAIMGTNVYAYLYDPIGNRQLASANEVTNLYQANELNQYTNINEGAVEPVYDADGNMTSYGSLQFTWDAENRLVKVAPHYLITGSRIYEYEYDYMSRRVKKTAKRYTMPMSTWTMRTFDYDGWNLVRERVEFDGAVSTNQYVWGLDLSGTLQGAGGVGGLLAILSPDSCLLAPAYDANGNITDLVDTNGSVVAHYEYDPYGNTIAQSGAQADVNPFRFSTKYWDGETGFYYYGYRFYSPKLGRWLSRDPMGDEAFLRRFVAGRTWQQQRKYREESFQLLYLFVANNTFNSVDIFGLRWIDQMGGIISDINDLVDNLVFWDRLRLFGVGPKCGWEVLNQAFLPGGHGPYDHCMASCELAKDCGSLVSLLLGLSLEEVQLIFAIYQGWSSEALEALVDGSVKDILWDLQGTKCTEDCHCCCLKETGGK